MISVDFLSDCLSVKTVSVLQRLHGTMSDVQKRGEQTDKNSTFLVTSPKISLRFSQISSIFFLKNSENTRCQNDGTE